MLMIIEIVCDLNNTKTILENFKFRKFQTWKNSNLKKYDIFFFVQSFVRVCDSFVSQNLWLLKLDLSLFLCILVYVLNIKQQFIVLKTYFDKSKSLIYDDECDKSSKFSITL